MGMEPDLAGKITGMLLEMSEGDVIAIIEDHMACQEKVCSCGRCFWSCQTACSALLWSLLHKGFKLTFAVKVLHREHGLLL